MKALPPICEEFEGAELPDLRLLDRLVKIASSLEKDPALSLPKALKGRGELEAAYRFLGNGRIQPQDVLSGHFEKTIERVGQHPVCLAIHDSTAFEFSGERSGLGRVDRAQQGFYGHFCLAVAPGVHREPLGLLAVETWKRTTKKGKRSTRQRRKEKGLESERWLRQSKEVEALVGPTTQLVHIEDREGDIYESFVGRISEGVRFIVRAAGTRVVLQEEGVENVLEHVRILPRLFTREVSLSARKQQIKLPKAQLTRQERMARLAFAATAVTLRRPRTAKSGAAELQLNAIHVIEYETTPKGEQPVEWLLFTTEPISTQAEVEFVVDSYRSRWLIEEYFKALKTGCGYEKRQLESMEALLGMLSIFAVIAWRLLLLRHIERTGGKAAPAEVVATRDEIAVMQAKKLLPKNPTVPDFMAAVAKYGGHLKNNGRPGYLVLWRGLTEIRTLAEGWALARKCDQS
jgi:hypothetical protein